MGGIVVLTISVILYNNQVHLENSIFYPHPLTDDEIKKYSASGLKTVVVYPIFTQNAYKPQGFYDYYNGSCSTCNTVSLKPFGIIPSYATGGNGFETLISLHYPFITDITVDIHPEILNEYDIIILLHNEYMTKKEFDAIKNHKNVLYLYPNSMYAEITVDYTNWTMTLVRGHGYPEKSIGNGFGYVTSSKHEYDIKCQNYHWESRPNGIQPTCWPEFLIKSDRSILQTIKDYPKKVPDLITPTNNTVDVSNIQECDWFGCKPKS